MLAEAVRCKATVQRRNPISLLSLLPPSPATAHIQQIHAHFIVIGGAGRRSVAAHLLAASALASPPSVHYCRAIFDRIEIPNTFARNNMIRCYARSDRPWESLEIYSSMRRANSCPNNYTFPFLLQACSRALAIGHGMLVHCHVVKLGFQNDLYIRNALIHLYGACCRSEEARRLFDESPSRRDLVSWNAIMAGHARDGSIDECRKLFEEMPERDSISWSTMIMAYVQGGKLEEGLSLFRDMSGSQIMPNEAALVTALSAAAQLGLLEHGKEIHSTMKNLKFPPTVPSRTALIDMYAKCGCIEIARELFNEMPERDVFVWNAMICGLATHGLGEEALALFQKFESEGLHPVNVTFVGVLSACSRAGLVEAGRQYFKSMVEDYGIDPEMEHYGCMVDLLGRAGFVEESFELIEKMTIQPDAVLWGTLLGACKIHGLADLGETIGRKLIELDPTHDGYYVLLANIYAKARKWQDVVEVRRLMCSRGGNKVAGWSLIEAHGGIHRFLAGDRSHERSAEIYEMLQEIGRRLAAAGYSPDVSWVLHDIGEEEKQHVIKEHSERLAIAFGLMVVEAGGVIRIVKNLRVCGDCHEASKMISKVFDREIVVRDGSRFHHFKLGECSCLDYW